MGKRLKRPSKVGFFLFKKYAFKRNTCSLWTFWNIQKRKKIRYNLIIQRLPFNIFFPFRYSILFYKNRMALNTSDEFLLVRVAEMT